MTMHFEPGKPICDGICYSDLWLIPDHFHNVLAARRLVFLTEWDWDGMEMGGDIIARSLRAARKIAFGRGLGERVIGRAGRIEH